MQILRREATPAPLVLQFIEDVLAIGPVAIQLTQGRDFVLQRRHQRSVFPQFLVRFDFAKAQQRLGRVASVADCDAVRQFAAQQNNTAMPAPTKQAQTGLLALPTLTGIHPVAVAHGPDQVAFHIRRHAQAEQIRQIVLLRARHDTLDAPGFVAA